MRLVAMVSPTPLLPGKTLVLVPGTKDLPRGRSAGSGLNSASLEHRNMLCAAGCDFELTLRVGLRTGEVVSAGAKESGEMMP